MAVYKDIAGRRSGRLTAKQFHQFGPTGAQLWLCECACGRTRVVSNILLLTGHARSCGWHRCEHAVWKQVRERARARRERRYG